MRLNKSESIFLVSKFLPNDTVIVNIYRLSDNTKVVDNQPMTEIVSTGFFSYQFSSNVTLREEFLWIASNGTNDIYGKLIVGDYIESVKESILNLNNFDPNNDIVNFVNTTDVVNEVISNIDMVDITPLEEKTNDIKNVVAPDIIDPLRMYNRIKEFILTEYTHSPSGSNHIRMNIGTRSLLEAELNTININSIFINNKPFDIIIDSSLSGEDFKIFSRL